MTKNSKNQQKSRDFAQKVRLMFDNIARRYDLANHLLSGGVDFIWRRKAVKLAKSNKDARLLDMCCGTGDLAFCFARHSGIGEAVGCDFSEEMIRLAQRKEDKLARKGKLANVQFNWQTADCTDTGFESESFDVISCGFGVRNMADLDAGLAEMHRLLRPGGKVCILEFTLPECIVCRSLYLLYLRYILPILGGIITSRLSAYRYFADSILDWVKKVELEKSLEAAGLKKIQTRSLSKGIAKVYVFEKGLNIAKGL